MRPQNAAGRWSLQGQYNYLLMLAQCQMPVQRRSVCEPVDMVQETLKRAHQNRQQCQAKTEAGFRAWLREILKNVIAEAARRIPRPPGIGRQVISLDKLVDEASSRFEEFLA